MPAQRDMFDPDPAPDIPAAPDDHSEEDTTAPASTEPLAAPCGFRDQRNQPCARLASKPLCIDGVQLVNRGIPMLMCHPGCFRGATSIDDASSQTRTDDPDSDRDMDFDRDPEDPGYDEAWVDGSWEPDEEGVDGSERGREEE